MTKPRNAHPLEDACEIAERKNDPLVMWAELEKYLAGLPRGVRTKVRKIFARLRFPSGGKPRDEELRRLATEAMRLKIAAIRNGEKVTYNDAAGIVSNDGDMQKRIVRCIKDNADALRKLALTDIAGNSMPEADVEKLRATREAEREFKRQVRRKSEREERARKSERLPAANQPLPDDPAERALFLSMQRDALARRQRLALIDDP